MKHVNIPKIGTTVKLGDVDYLVVHNCFITYKGVNDISTYLIKLASDDLTVFDQNGSTEYADTVIHEKCKIYYEHEIPDDLKPLLMTTPWCYDCPVFIPTRQQVGGTSDSGRDATVAGEWEYFKDRESRIFTNESGTAYFWWLQSQWPDSPSFGVCCVSTGGGVGYSHPDCTLGFRPAICMRTEDLMKYLEEAENENKEPNIKEEPDSDPYENSILSKMDHILKEGEVINFNPKYTNNHNIDYVIIKSANDMDSIMYLMPLNMDQCVMIPRAMIKDRDVGYVLCHWYAKTYLRFYDSGHCIIAPSVKRELQYPYLKEDKNRIFRWMDGVPIPYWVYGTSNRFAGVDCNGKIVGSEEIKDDTILAFRPVIRLTKRELFTHMKIDFDDSLQLMFKLTDTITIGQVTYSIIGAGTTGLLIKPVHDFEITCKQDEIDKINEIYYNLLVRPYMDANVVQAPDENQYDQKTGVYTPVVLLDNINAITCISKVLELDNGNYNYTLHK